VLRQGLLRAHAREHEQVRRVHCAGAQDDLAGCGDLGCGCRRCRRIGSRRRAAEAARRPRAVVVVVVVMAAWRLAKRRCKGGGAGRLVPAQLARAQPWLPGSRVAEGRPLGSGRGCPLLRTSEAFCLAACGKLHAPRAGLAACLVNVHLGGLCAGNHLTGGEEGGGGGGGRVGAIGSPHSTRAAPPLRASPVHMAPCAAATQAQGEASTGALAARRHSPPALRRSAGRTLRLLRLIAGLRYWRCMSARSPFTCVTWNSP
jgi:hypothetical protein